MMIKKIQLYFSILFLFCIFSFSQSLLAEDQKDCTFCNTIQNAIEDQFLDNLSQSFSDAHVIAATGAMPYIGGVRINRISLGAQLNYGMKTSISDTTTDKGKVNGLGNSPLDFIVYGSYHAGINLGNFLGLFNFLPGVSHLSKYDILFSHSEAKNLIKLSGVKIGFETSYIGLRYQMINGLTLPILGGWKGLVFGIGYMTSKVNFSAIDGSPSDVSIADNNDESWISESEKFTLESKLKSFPIELNTGVEILFFNVTYSLGTLLNSGETLLKYRRDGGQVGAHKFDLRTESKTKPSSTYFYNKIGLEFPIFPFVRFGAEALYGEKGALGYTLALRISI